MLYRYLKGTKNSWSLQLCAGENLKIEMNVSVDHHTL